MQQQPITKPARNMGAVGLFFLILAGSACSFSSWWYMNYRVGGGRPAVNLPQATADAIGLLNLNSETRFLKKYTVYGARKETLRTVFQNDARTLEGECQTVTTHWLWSKNKATKCIFEFDTFSGFGTDAQQNAAKANVKAWCDQRCDDVKAMRKTTCKSVAYDISRPAGGISGSVAGGNGGGLAEAEFDEELLCGGTGGGAFAMMVSAMLFSLLGLLLAFAAPAMRGPIVGLAGLCFLLFLCTAILYGVKTTAFLGTTFHENEGFASDMPNNAKFGLDIGYALLLLITLLSAALLGLLLKPAPKPQTEAYPMYQTVVSQQPTPNPAHTEVVFQEPVKNEEPVKRQAAPVTVGSTAPAAPMMPGYQTYVQSPYQNLGMQTYPFMGGAA